MANPKTFSKTYINTTSDQDALQIKDVKGDIVGWIDATGTGQGNLASGGGGGTPGGSNTQVQFNNSGSFGGATDFTWDKSTGTLQLGSTGTAVVTDRVQGAGVLPPGGGDGSQVLRFTDADPIAGPYVQMFHVQGRPTGEFGFESITPGPSAPTMQFGMLAGGIYEFIVFEPLQHLTVLNDNANGGTGMLQLAGLRTNGGATTVAGLASVVPAATEGDLRYVTNGRKVGEGPGAGTGVYVYFSNGSWRVFSTDAAVQA